MEVELKLRLLTTLRNSPALRISDAIIAEQTKKKEKKWLSWEEYLGWMSWIEWCEYLMDYEGFLSSGFPTYEGLVNKEDKDIYKEYIKSQADGGCSLAKRWITEHDNVNS